MVAFTAKVLELREGAVLVLSFPSQRDVDSFRQQAAGGGVSDVLRAAITEVLGATVKFLTRVDSDETESSTQDYSAAAAAATKARPAAAAPAETPTAKPQAKSSPAAEPAVEAGDWDVITIPGAQAPADAVPTEEEPAFAPEPPAEFDEPPFEEPIADEPASEAAVSIEAAPVEQVEPAAASAKEKASVPRAKSKAPGGSARYGESVVREVLGAEFIEEEPRA